MRIKIVVLFFLGLLSPIIEAKISCNYEKYIEYYMYWAPELRAEDSPVTKLISKQLEKKKWGVRNWQVDRYFPWIISWSQVHGWKEFIWWLGLNRPGSEPMESDTAYCMFWNLGPKLKKCDFSRLPNEKLVLILWEPPVVEPEAYKPDLLSHFGKVFTWDDDLVDNEKFFKIYYPEMRPQIDEIIPFEQKKFCTMVARRLSSSHPKQLYSEREKVIRFFENIEGEFDLYGPEWEKRNYKNSRGRIGDKISYLKNYKFNICYENTRDIKGYITEKIFDCFTARVVPIYWGASNITDYIPETAFIDRRKFQNTEELYNFLKSVTKERYEEYLEAAEEFLNSEKAQLFTYEQLEKTFNILL